MSTPSTTPRSRTRHPFTARLLTAVVLCVGPLLAGAAVGQAAPAEARPSVVLAGTGYYVDPVNGNDTYTGTSWQVSGNAGPWKTLDKLNSVTFVAGESIHLKAGGVWNGRLTPHGSGTSTNPIQLGMYGTGAKPRINGGGTLGGTVSLYNQQGWEIHDLEITNSAASSGIRSAVHIQAQDVGTMNHIHVRRLDIHDVTGIDGDRDNGGVIVAVTGNSVPTKFNDVRISDNTIHDEGRQGINISSTWINRTSGWNPSTGVVIADNRLTNIGGDAIVISGTTGAQVTGNVAGGCITYPTASGACIWTWNTDGTRIAYNETYGARYNNGPDGMGLDIDKNTTGGILEYNYSHDNGNGGALIYAGTGPGDTNTGTIVRYNIFESNGIRELWSEGPHRDAQVYNNVFYDATGVGTKPIDIRDNPVNTKFLNNIFYNRGTGGYALGSGTGTVFDHNVFYGTVSTPADAHKITSDPLFVSPGTGGNGRETVGGYKLKIGSPALGSGLLIANNGGLDYWGNAVSSSSPPNRGAYNGSAVASLTMDRAE